MMRLLTAIRKSPKWKAPVTGVACYGCRICLPPADAYVDYQGYIWCHTCK